MRFPCCKLLNKNLLKENLMRVKIALRICKQINKSKDKLELSEDYIHEVEWLQTQLDGYINQVQENRNFRGYGFLIIGVIIATLCGFIAYYSNIPRIICILGSIILTLCFFIFYKEEKKPWD